MNIIGGVAVLALITRISYGLLIDFNEIANNSFVGSFYSGVQFSPHFTGWALIKRLNCGESPPQYRDMGIRIMNSNSPAILNYEDGFSSFFAFFFTQLSMFPPSESCRITVLLWVIIA